MSRLVNAGSLGRRNIPLMLTSPYGGRLYFHNGSSWIEHQPKGNVNANWAGFAMNIDGSKMAVSEYNGRFYYFNGSTWSIMNPDGWNGNRAWWSVRMNKNGQIVTFKEGTNNINYYNGSSWVNLVGSSGSNVGLCLSEDGSTVYQPQGTNSYIDVKNTSNNTSSSLSFAVLGTVAGSTRSIAVSADKSKLFIARDPGRLIKYENETWSYIGPNSNNANWYFISVSEDGNKILAGIYNGRLWFFDGSNWSELQPKGNVNGAWRDGALSVDGSRIFVVEATGRCYYYDSVNWSEMRPNGVDQSYAYYHTAFRFIE